MTGTKEEIESLFIFLNGSKQGEMRASSVEHKCSKCDKIQMIGSGLYS